MIEKKNLFRRVFDAIIEGRSAQAQRHIEEYLRAHGTERQPKA
jgi:hypothetical protein